MALPTNIKTSLDRLYDMLISGNVDDNTVIYDKVTVGQKLFKIKVNKKVVDGKINVSIEILER